MQGIRSKWPKMSRCCSAFLLTAWETHPHRSGHLISSLGKMILFTASNYDCKSIISSYITLPLLSHCGCIVPTKLFLLLLVRAPDTFPCTLTILAPHIPTSPHFLPSYFPVSSLFLFSATELLLLDQDSTQPWFPLGVSPPHWKWLTEKQKRVIVTERVGQDFYWLETSRDGNPPQRRLLRFFLQRFGNAGGDLSMDRLTPALQFIETIDHCG